jgi:L-lysine 2,3-aminomutase
LNNITPASISADKQANVALQAQVAVAKKVNDQPKIAGELIQAAAQSTPEPGKGQKLSVIA